MIKVIMIIIIIIIISIIVIIIIIIHILGKGDVCALGKKMNVLWESTCICLGKAYACALGRHMRLSWEGTCICLGQMQISAAHPKSHEMVSNPSPNACQTQHFAQNLILDRFKIIKYFKSQWCW